MESCFSGVAKKDTFEYHVYRKRAGTKYPSAPSPVGSACAITEIDDRDKQQQWEFSVEELWQCGCSMCVQVHYLAVVPVLVSGAFAGSKFRPEK